MSAQLQNICILGATGTIGTQALNIIRRFPNQFNLHSLQVHSRLADIEPILHEFRPTKLLVTGAPPGELAHKFPDIEIIDGFTSTGQDGSPGQSQGRGRGQTQSGANAGAQTGAQTGAQKQTGAGAQAEPDARLESAYRSLLGDGQTHRVVHGIVGTAGLLPTVLCLEFNIDLAIANKESLVVSGGHLPELRNKSTARIIPVDSEHNAIFQLLEERQGVDGVILTSSGGPFLNTDISELAGVTVEEALQHPTWQMGPKITVDSATMVNKSLEILEARYLFGFDLDKVRIVIHPQSIVHGLIQMDEGSFFAFMAPTSMEFPLAHAMFYPQPVPELLFPNQPQGVDLLTEWNRLDFLPVDSAKYPAVDIAYEVGRTGGTAPAIYNGANEAAVDRFLRAEIGFTQITENIQAALDAVAVQNSVDWQDCLQADRRAREYVRGLQ